VALRISVVREQTRRGASGRVRVDGGWRVSGHEVIPTHAVQCHARRHFGARSLPDDDCTAVYGVQPHYDLGEELSLAA